MKRKPVWILASIVVLLLASSLLWNYSMQAAGPTGRAPKGRRFDDDPPKPNFDIRDTSDKDTALKFERRMEKFSSKEKEKNASLKLAMKGAEGKKAKGDSDLEVAFSNLTNSLGVIEAKGKGSKAMTPRSSQSRESIFRGFLNENPRLFGMSPQQVAGLRKSAEYTNPTASLSWLRMEERGNGLPVFQGEAVAAFTSSGELMRITSGLTAGPEAQSLETETKVPAEAAVVAAADSIGVALTPEQLVVQETDGQTVVFYPVGQFTDPIEVTKVFFPLDNGLATVAWEMVLWLDTHSYLAVVDGLEGAGLMFRKTITNYQTQTATYSVYNDDSPAPLSP